MSFQRSCSRCQQQSFQIKSLLWVSISMLCPDRCCGCRFNAPARSLLWMPRRSLLWMPILTLRPDWRMSTIATRRRMKVWWSFSVCDWRSMSMISRLGWAWVSMWVTGGRRTKNTKSEESKKNAMRVSGWWVWAFCSEEEQIKKKRERKKSGEEREKKRKKEKKERKERVTGGMWLAFGAHNLLLFTNMLLKSDFEWWKHVKPIFIIHDLIRFFEWWKLNIEWLKHLNQTSP